MDALVCVGLVDGKQPCLLVFGVWKGSLCFRVCKGVCSWCIKSMTLFLFPLQL